VLLAPVALLAQEGLRAGAARREITPREATPMWGYAARHAALAKGTRDPLFADALVLESGGKKLAIVSLDLGRSPNERSLEKIRARIGMDASVIAGSHTHHGPVLELSDEPGKGKGVFDATLRYYAQLEDAIVGSVTEAAARLEPAQLRAGSAQLRGFNRNRQSKLAQASSDRELVVMVAERLNRDRIATVVNFSAHPTMLPAELLEYSADWVGAMKNEIRTRTGGAALFLQGSTGDQSVDRGNHPTPEGFGKDLAAEAMKVETSAVAAGKMQVKEDRFRFPARTDYGNPFLQAAFKSAFFNELVPNYVDEYKDGVRPRLTVALLGPELGIVAMSGEFFSGHALSLKARARMKSLVFAGYANGYHQYFPTIEAAAEGGYGTNLETAPAELGAGEQMMNSALRWLYQMRGQLK
jgi:hypothetical protein